jgi:hypothetical protein
MIHVSKTVRVNSGLAPGEPALDAHQMWHGLVMKAEDPIHFVRGITACRVLQRWPDGILREVTLRGHQVRERIVYRVGESVTFVRLNGRELGMIRNDIGHDPEHGLCLRFTFDLEVEGIVPGSDAEAAFAARMEGDYTAAVQATVDRIRALVKEGALAA